MNSTKTRTAVAIVTTIILIAGVITVVKWRRSRLTAREVAQAAEISASIDRIQQVNLSRPESQVRVKSLIFAAMIQKQIPPASTWCETLNVGNRVWPNTPTNTVFALNSRVAGRAYSKTERLPGDVVVFFETPNPGWNQAGGPELLASNPEGVAVAFADGRSLIVPPTEAANLRWNP
jgi:hypothetical protein